MKYFFGILIALLCVLNASAQTKQNGIIQEYNEKAHKTPLAGVELNVRSAQSTTSDKQGRFSLDFLTLKPGEKVNVRRIEKLGYEIFNKEAVEQWNINPKNPFIIVMCRSDKFKAIRDNYQRVASENYDKQYKIERAKLNKLKKEGKLKEAEYQKQLVELTKNYDRQLDNLDNYVDKFSRIDLSELSQIEQEIIGLVQTGRIDEAIAKYEEQDYLSKYTQEVEQIKKISSALDKLENLKQSKDNSKDSLLAAINRQIETLMLAGGKSNFDKINTILYEIANCDTTNYKNMYKYGLFLYSQNQYKEAENCLKTSLANCKDTVFCVKITIALSETYNSISEFRSSETIIRHAINNYDTIKNEDVANLYYALGNVLFKQTLFDEAEQMFLKSAKIIENSESIIEGRIYYSLSSLYRTKKDYKNAIYFGEKSLNLFESLNIGHETSDIAHRIIQCKSNIAKIYYYSQDYSNASISFDLLIKELKNRYSKNPQKYAEEYAWNRVMYSKVISRLDKYSEALKHLSIALAIYENLYEEYPTAYGRAYMQALEEYGVNLIKNNSINSEIYFDKAAEIAEYLYTLDAVAFRPLYFMNLYTDAFRYYSNQEYNKSIEKNKAALTLATPLYKKDPQSYGEVYTSVLVYLGESYNKLNQIDSALSYHERCLDLRQNLYNKGKSISEINLAEAYRCLAGVQSSKGLYSNAISNYKHAFNIYDSISLKKPKYKQYSFAMQRNIASIYSEALSDYKNAHISIDQALLIFPNHIEALEQKGLIFIKQEDWNNANYIYKQILDVETNYSSTKSQFLNIIKQHNGFNR